ncbi:MAG TPA: polysaccharide pyruvyl transferase family protein [Dongiaceae bacterium]|nr:polysaccharide pyruvyl transferase family protein [Dongiaceae bacterium]
MTNASPIKRIGIFGHVGTQNMGDEIIIEAVIQNIRSRHPGAEIRAFTFNPDDTRARHAIPAFPIRRRKFSASRPVAGASIEIQSGTATSSVGLPGGGVKAILKRIPFLFAALKMVRNGLQNVRAALEEIAFLVRSSKNLRGVDLLLIAGSGQLTDASGGAWAYPYTFFKWFLLSRLVGTKLAFVSIGTGWIDSSLSKFFLRTALRGADYRSFREESAVQRVEALGVTGENPIVPDLAYSLQMPSGDSATLSASSAKTVGINPIPFFHPVLWHEADPARYTTYTDAHADFALWLIDRGYSVVFFPTQLRADPPVIADVIAAMERRRAGVSAQLLPSPQLHAGDDLLAAMARMDFVVAARFHGVLVSHLLGKPVLGVSYHQKTADLMARMGQQDCTLKIEECSSETLKQTFCFIESHQAAIRAEFARRVPECRAALDSQYERVFGLLEPRTAATKTLNTSAVPAKEPSNARINYGS